MLVLSNLSYLRILILFLSLLTSSLLAVEVRAESNGSAPDGAKCLLTVGMDHWPPYQIYQSDGSVVGLQVTLVKRIAKDLNCELKFQRMSYLDAQEALQKGTIDMQINAAYTKDRAKFAYFSTPYRAEFMMLYSTQKYYEKCQTMSLEELIRDGFKLAVQHGIVYGKELTNIQQDPELNQKLYYVNSGVQHLKLLRDKNLDGVVDDPAVVAYRSSVNASGDTLKACPITISQDSLSFMLSRKTQKESFLKRLNKAIETVKQTEYYRSNWVWY